MPQSPGSTSNQPSNPSSDSTTEAIMQAVYRALSKHGYPDLTMAHIASEFDRSKSLLYYHYDGKEALLNDFFAHICERMEQDLIDEDEQDPWTRLEGLMDQIVNAAMDDEQLHFRQAFFEIRTQAPHQSSYREQIQRTDDILLDVLTETIELGIETDEFEPVDPEDQAEFIFSSLYGIMFRGVTLEDRDMIERNRRFLDRQLEYTLRKSPKSDH